MDRELRGQLDQINQRLDHLSPTLSQKPKTSMVKRISIAVPLVVAFIGLLGTGYELGLRFLENQSNRETIRFYTTLAKNLVESGNYQAAKVYVNQAGKIDANNADVVSTNAFIDIMDWIDVSVRTNSEALPDAIYSLKMLNLSQHEIHYHIGTVAAQANKLDIARDHFSAIPPVPERYSLRARARLISDVYQRTLKENQGMQQPVGETMDEMLDVLSGFASDVMEFSDDVELRGNFVERAYAAGYALVFNMPAEKLPVLQEILAPLHPPNHELVATLHSRIESSSRGEAADPEVVLANLIEAQKRGKESSPVAQQVNEAITRYSAQVQLETTAVAQDSDEEAERRRGVVLRNEGRHQDAAAIFQDIIRRYEENQRPGDKTLYKTYFNLALVFEYGARRPKSAIQYYEKAEQLAAELGLQDPSIHNTFGYLYYKLGRDEGEPEAKKELLTKAQDKLSAALEVDPGYDKSRRTLVAVETEFEKLKQREYYERRVQQAPEQLSRLKRQ